MRALLELPYPPKPRLVPLELGRRSAAPAAGRFACLTAWVFVCAMFAAAPVAMGWLAITCLRDVSLHVAWRLSGFIVFMVLALVYLKSLLPRRIPLPPAVIPVKRDDQPNAYAFVERVADDLQAPPPRRILLGSGVEIELSARASLVHLLGGGHWDMAIGYWLWQSLTLSELQATLARTLAPRAGSRLQRWSHSAHVLAQGLVLGKDMLDDLADSAAPLAGWARLVGRIHAGLTYPLRLLGNALLRLTAGAGRALADDLAALPLAGSDALVHAILRADFAGATLRELNISLDELADVGVRTTDMYSHAADAANRVWEASDDFTLGQTPQLRGPNAGKYADVFEPGQPYLSSVWHGLPAPAAREQNAKRTFVAAERDDRPAQILIDSPLPLRAQLTRLHYSESLGVPSDTVALDAAVVSRWLALRGRPAIDARYVGCYDDCRAVDPGTPSELYVALSNDSWDDGRLLTTIQNLYAKAGQHAARWQSTRAALDKVLRRTLYRPSGRDRAIAEDLHDDVRKAMRWLNALDRWAYLAHVQMAARLPELDLHEELLAQYDRVQRFQGLAGDARDFRNRLAAYVRHLEHYVNGPSPRLVKEARKEFRASSQDFERVLDEAEQIGDEGIVSLTGGLPLQRFLYSRDERPVLAGLTTVDAGLELLSAWDEVRAKTRWLHELNVAQLLAIHERIAEAFREQVGPLPTDGIPNAIVLDADAAEYTPLELQLDPAGGAAHTSPHPDSVNPAT